MEKEIKVYAAWSLDDNVRMNSTSGGIFTELAKEVIGQGYSVVGARYDSKNTVVHDLIDKVEDIPLLRQSKYVQSDMSGIREKMKNKKVMFVGSPCQCASVEADIKIDFVCRGANSPKAYRSYLQMLKSQYNSEIIRVWFKNKTYGWHKFSTRVDFENGKTYLKDRSQDLYMLGYIRHNLFILDRCYKCKFKGFPRPADITLGDFWGVRKEFDANKGTSLVIINTEKGQELFDKLDIYKTDSTLEEAVRQNPSIIKPPPKGQKSDLFMMLLDKYPFDECFRRCKL